MLTYRFRDLAHYHHGRKHGGTWGDTVLEKEFYIWIGRQQKERVSYWAWLELLKPQSPPPAAHFLWQGHIYSNKATPPNITIPFGPTGAIFIQTTTEIHGQIQNNVITITIHLVLNIRGQ